MINKGFLTVTVFFFKSVKCDIFTQRVPLLITHGWPCVCDNGSRRPSAAPLHPQLRMEMDTGVLCRPPRRHKGIAEWRAALGKVPSQTKYNFLSVYYCFHGKFQCMWKLQKCYVFI